jgi:beta-lactamase regulating signal transducer with metallopeptidase domain/Flp pilus assembly secretin CpaC
MDATIETLNRWGGHALGLAWPMLWQSSLLVALLFALDFALRRKVRAAIRYALWLVVLVKLMLPPSLALPTGAGWWLRPVAPAPVRSHRATTVVVSYPTTTMPSLPLPATPVFTPPTAPPPTPLSVSAWALLAWSAVGIGLLGWLAARWGQVARNVRRATPTPGRLTELFDEGRHAVKLPRSVRLRLTDRPMSPAVCGLFRPVILLPRALADQLSPAQLRAVLLHELVHLRRGDVWVNCAQALLQIVYWWHPLLWLANARIRRVREEAVDDAVMLALRGDAETYPPTLLEVAKLAFNRPLASLGLVGILESKNALRQRIERLMDFRPPRKAGLTLASFLCVFAFGALAVPMGEAPPKLAGNASVSPPNDQGGASETNSLASTNLMHTGRGRQTISDKLNRIRMETVGPWDLPLADVVRILTDEARERDPEGNGVNFVINRIDVLAGIGEAVDIGAIRVRFNTALSNLRLADVLEVIQKTAGRPIMFTVDDYAVVFSLRGQETTPLYTRTFKVDRSTFLRELESVKAFSLGGNYTGGNGGGDGLGLTAGTNYLDGISGAVRTYIAGLGVDLTQPGKAVFFHFGNGASGGEMIVRATMQDLDVIEQAIQVLNTRPHEGQAVMNASAIVGGATAVADRDGGANELSARKYEADTNTALSQAALELRKRVARYGVDTNTPPQVNIKARFVEITQDSSKALGPDWNLGGFPTTNAAMDLPWRTSPPPNGTPVFRGQLLTNGLRDSASAAATFTGILSDPQFRTVLQALEQRHALVLAEPEITMLSGRQAQMKATEIRTVLKPNPQALVPPGVGTAYEIFLSDRFECGPILDVVPRVMADGYTIALNMTATDTEFLGRDESGQTNLATVYVGGQKEQINLPMPRFRTSQSTVRVNVLDGQTVVFNLPIIKNPKVRVRPEIPLLGGFRGSTSTTSSPPQCVVFVTPMIVDPAGNRIHGDNEVPSPNRK